VRSKNSNLCSTVDTGDGHSKVVPSKLSIPYENANLNIPVSDDLPRNLLVKTDNILQFNIYFMFFLFTPVKKFMKQSKGLCSGW
jgi:hypothetical protein